MQILLKFFTKLRRSLSDHIEKEDLKQEKKISMPVHYRDFEFDLGNKVKHLVTGEEGIVVASTQWINNCNTFRFSSCRTRKGNFAEDQAFDAPLLQFVSHGVKSEFAETREFDYIPFKFNLGDKVISKLDRFSGLVVARCAWLSGCNAYFLKSTGLYSSGEPKEGIWISEISLEQVYKNPYFNETHTDSPDTRYTGGMTPLPRSCA